MWVLFETDRDQPIEIRRDAVMVIEDRDPKGSSLLVGGRWIWVKENPQRVRELLS